LNYILRALSCTVLFALVATLAGCTPSENLFNTGRDARVYNPMTRQYEWPDPE